jgi:predicted RNA-binding Zn-ribbon protein involved in translation (DUF1610 family)
MSRSEHNCPYCKEEMEAGLLLDRGHGNRPVPQEWLEGNPEASFWLGLKTKNKRKLHIVAYRCPRCGLLQDYALE